MRKVLVTGARGFIGRPVVSRLVELGYDVHAVTSSHPDSAPLGVTTHAFDLRDSLAIESVMALVRPSHLLHLAWITAPPHYWTSLDNLRWVEASLRLVDAFRREGGARLVVAGSCAEYEWGHGQCSEYSTPLQPTTLYGCAKHALRLLVEAYAAQAGLSFAWGRVFFAYGPRERETRLVPSVIRGLLARERVPCTEGTQQRDFLHVDDVARAFVSILDSEVSGSINIGSGQPTALKDLIAEIARIVEGLHLVDLGALPQRHDEPAVLVADISRLTMEVGWRPRITLERGLASTIDWWRDRSRGATL